MFYRNLRRFTEIGARDFEDLVTEIWCLKGRDPESISDLFYSLLNEVHEFQY